MVSARVVGERMAMGRMVRWEELADRADLWEENLGGEGSPALRRVNHPVVYR